MFILPRNKEYPMRLLVLIPFLSATLTGCSGGSSSSPASLADDALTSGDPQTTNANLLVGTWDLTGNWDGEPGDVAYLVIGEFRSDNTAPTTFYDYDGDSAGFGESCYDDDYGIIDFEPSTNTALHFLGLPFDNATLSVGTNTQSLMFNLGLSESRKAFLTVLPPSGSG